MSISLFVSIFVAGGLATMLLTQSIKSAVGRNRIRRRVYEAVRKNFEYLPEKTDYIFVIFSKDILTMPLPELEKLLVELVEESKVCYNR